jgi:hypothetical protein
MLQAIFITAISIFVNYKLASSSVGVLGDTSSRILFIDQKMDSPLVIKALQF